MNHFFENIYFNRLHFHRGGNIVSKLKPLLSKRLGFFSFAVILFWLKTYLVYQIEFELGVTGLMQ